jgi:hypothetical protein
MLVCTKLDRLIKTFFLAVIRVTVRAIELPFDDKILVLTLDHDVFNALTAGNFTTTYQINRFPVFKIERKFTERTF